MTIGQDESAIEFANRVKHEIACKAPAEHLLTQIAAIILTFGLKLTFVWRMLRLCQGGLVDLMWDGNLKRNQVNKLAL